MKESQFDYVVSLSYAHEDRKFVNSVARHLRTNGVTVYTDENDQIESWGDDLIKRLDSIYGKQSKFCVVFISKHYKAKSWTQFEHRVLQARALKEKRQFILPFRMDNTEIAGWPDTINYLSIKDYGSERLAKAIIKKISDSNDKSVPLINIRERLRRIFTKKVINKITAVFLVLASLFVFTNKLIPVDILAERLHEESKEETQYAMCEDGSISPSHGSGTCSHHIGVYYYFDTTVYRKTPQQCREEAKQISWWAVLDK